MLLNLRKFFKNKIVSTNLEEALNIFQAEFPIKKDYFDGDVLIFEDKIGEIRTGYQREDRKYDFKLAKKFPTYWERLSKIEKDTLRISEELYSEFIKSNFKRQLMTAIIQEYWRVLEFSRKCFLTSLVNTFKNHFSSFEDETIYLPSKHNGFSLYDLIEKILKKECSDFQAFETQMLLKKSFHAHRASSEFLQFISDMLGRGLIGSFVENHSHMRTMRNNYKAINMEKTVDEQKNDLDSFRSILFDEENSPLVLFEKFEERLYET